MPQTALKNLAKRAGLTLKRAEYLWKKSAGIVDDEYQYDNKNERYWALRMGITKKMMGLSERMSFAEYLRLSEASVSDTPAYSGIDLSATIDLFKKHCSDAMWMLTNNVPLYRGDSDKQLVRKLHSHGAVTVDPSKTERKSENTSNYYTVILDNHPDRENFPKRSRSFIASTESDTAYGYGDENYAILVPYNGVKIGVVGQPDMWDTTLEIFDFDPPIEMNIADFNSFYSLLGLQPNMASFLAFDKRVNDNDPTAKTALAAACGMVMDLADVGLSAEQMAEAIMKVGFMSSIWKMYSRKSTGHEVATTKTLKRVLSSFDESSEVWVGGPCLMISQESWNKMSHELT